MDKEQVIRVINEYYSTGNLVIVLVMYCRDRGKKEEDIAKLIQALPMLPLPDMVQDAISWYAKELNLTIINKIENNQLKPFKIL
jgi:hypothetical protein